MWYGGGSLTADLGYGGGSLTGHVNIRGWSITGCGMGGSVSYSRPRVDMLTLGAGVLRGVVW